MKPRNVCERLKVTGIGSEKGITVRGKQDEGGIHDVIHSGSPQQDACSAAQPVIQRNHVDSWKQPSEGGLASGTPSPNLANDATVGDGYSSV